MPTLFLEGSGPKWGTGKRRTEQVQYVFFFAMFEAIQFSGIYAKIFAQRVCKVSVYFKQL